PAVIPLGMRWSGGSSFTTPAIVTNPTRDPMPPSVNHTFPSGPGAMPAISAFDADMVYSTYEPVGVIRPILPIHSSNHRLPSGPIANERRVAAGRWDGELRDAP